MKRHRLDFRALWSQTPRTSGPRWLWPGPAVYSIDKLDRKIMKTAARNHHVGPQGYLAAFTDTGARGGKLCAFDFKTRRFFQTSPRNVAGHRDFNRISIDGLEMDGLEKAFGELEGRAVAIIRAICTDGCVPPDEEFSYVLNLISLLVIRNPKRRASLVKARA